MSSTYQLFVRIMIGFSLVLIMVGLYEAIFNVSVWGNVSDIFIRPIETINRQDIASQPTPAPVDAAPSDGCCTESSASDAQTNPTAVLSTDSSQSIVVDTSMPQYEISYWQDDFTNTSSGWEPYFEIKGELPVYAYVNTSKPETANLLMSDINYVTSSATAWNGYDGGDYSFTLPGTTMTSGNGFVSLVTPYLWDFNISQPMPAYPYLVDVSVSTTSSAGAMVLLDFAGDFNNVSAGSGIMVMMPLRQHNDIMYIGESHDRIIVWEFNENRLWRLGCEQIPQADTISSFPTSLHAKFVVDQSTLSMHISGNNWPDINIGCTREFSGDNNKTRFLGIGSRFWSLQVPVPYANVLRFHNIVVAQPDDTVLNQTGYVIDNSISEIRNASCDPFSSELSENVSLDSALRGSCFDTVTWVTDPNPGATRVEWPAQTDLSGKWQCGNSSETFAGFEIRTEGDYAIIAIAGLEYRIVATTSFDYPFMFVHIPYGTLTNLNTGIRKWHSEGLIGDYMQSPSRTWYGMRLNPEGTLQTSWMNQPCTRN